MNYSDSKVCSYNLKEFLKVLDLKNVTLENSDWYSILKEPPERYTVVSDVIYNVINNPLTVRHVTLIVRNIRTYKPETTLKDLLIDYAKHIEDINTTGLNNIKLIIEYFQSEPN